MRHIEVIIIGVGAAMVVAALIFNGLTVEEGAGANIGAGVLALLGLQTMVIAAALFLIGTARQERPLNASYEREALPRSQSAWK